MSNHADHVAARLLDAGAHAMRNDLATLHMAASLVDDEDVSASVATAVADLRVHVERAIVAARVELGARPDDVTLDAGELLRLGAARARREGATGVEVDGFAIEPATITGPGTWLERLAADVLHVADESWLVHLADACGVQLARADGVVTLRANQ